MCHDPVQESPQEDTGSAAHDPLLSRLEDFFSSPTITTAIGEFMSNEANQMVITDITAEQPFKNYEVT